LSPFTRSKLNFAFKLIMRNCVYILFCCNKRFYIGSASDLVVRLKEHIFGYVKATRHLRPVMLVFHQSYLTLKEARKAEYWIKKQKKTKILKQILADGILKKKFD